MAEEHVPRRVENYTRPFLVTVGGILFMAFWTIASLWGFLAVLITAAVLDTGFKLLPRAED